MAKDHVSSQRERRKTAAASPRHASVASFAAPTAAEAANIDRLQNHIEMLRSMGFELTLCQKAVGMFGEDMEAAVAWLTDDRTQQDARRMQRSPSWQRAEDLAQAMGAFSVRVCKRALEKTRDDPNNAAMWLLDHGASAEAEMEAEDGDETTDETAVFNPSASASINADALPISASSMSSSSK